jgi:branched-chain amino acid transport system permease protein
MGVYSIAVTGLDILFGYSGQISFGHAAYYLVGAYTTAIMTSRYGVPPLIGIVFGAVFASIVGIMIAFPASNLVHHFLSFLTIAFGNIAYNIVTNLNFTGRHNGIGGIPPVSLFGLKLDAWSSYLFFVAFVMIVMLIVKYRIINSRTGRAFMAIRDNTPAADGCGVNVKKYKIMAFAVSAFYTGLAGALYAHMIRFISPDTFTLTQSILFMTMLLFGGMGTFAGPIIGSVVLTLVQGWLQMFSIYQMLVYAAFIVLVLYFMPNGVQGLFYLAKDRIYKRVKNNREVNSIVKN